MGRRYGQGTGNLLEKLCFDSRTASETPFQANRKKTHRTEEKRAILYEKRAILYLFVAIFIIFFQLPWGGVTGGDWGMYCDDCILISGFSLVMLFRDNRKVTSFTRALRAGIGGFIVF